MLTRIKMELTKSCETSWRYEVKDRQMRAEAASKIIYVDKRLFGPRPPCHIMVSIELIEGGPLWDGMQTRKEQSNDDENSGQRKSTER